MRVFGGPVHLEDRDDSLRSRDQLVDVATHALVAQPREGREHVVASAASARIIDVAPGHVVSHQFTQSRQIVGHQGCAQARRKFAVIVVH